jgi:hypothetical protein
VYSSFWGVEVVCHHVDVVDGTFIDFEDLL